MLTAAHCFDGRASDTEIFVFMGSIVFIDDCKKVPKGVECLKVKSFRDVITHPEYNSLSSYINDIALVKLPSNKYQLNKKTDYYHWLRSLTLPVNLQQSPDSVRE